MDNLKKYGVKDFYIEEANNYNNLKLARVIAQYKGIYKIATDKSGNIFNSILDERRLNYFKLKRESSYEGLTNKQIEIKKLDNMFKEVGGTKKSRKFIKDKAKRV